MDTDRSYYRYIRNLVAFRIVTIILTLLALILPLFILNMPPWSLILSLFALFFLIMTSVFDRNYYLRFLNRSIFPTGLLVAEKGEKKKEGKEHYEMTFPQHKNTKIIYWASKSGSFSHPKEAYGDYTNGGVTMTDGNGVAQLILDENPGEYIVPYIGLLKPHIHYRFVETNGMLGEVRTYFL